MYNIQANQNYRRKQNMKIENTLNSKEKILTKIIEWCHKNDRKVTDMDYKTLSEAFAAPIRNSCPSSN